MSQPIPEPTSAQCSTKERVQLPDGGWATAAWYPQMGGYVGRCWIIPDGGCFEVLVWHDGDFPFADGDIEDYGHRVRRLHHCDPAQFIDFGELAARVIAAEDERP